MRRDADALTRFFHRVTREAYGELDLRDDALAGYVADVLVRFARTEGLYRLRGPGERNAATPASGLLPRAGGPAAASRRLDTIVEMLLEVGRAEPGVAPHPEREREIRRHVGDYALFGALAADFPRHAGALTYMRQVHLPRRTHQVDVALGLRDLLS